MLILLSEAVQSGAPQLLKVEDFHRFKVLAVVDTDARRTRTLPALDALGRLDGEDRVFVEPSTIRRLAGPLGRDPEWRRHLDEMITSAAERGAVDSEGNLCAQVEWV